MRSRLRSAALTEAWFDNLGPAQRELARKLREAITGVGAPLDATVKWGNLVFSLHRTHAVAIAAYREHVNLQVFNGAALRRHHPGLLGGGKQLRHLRFALGAPVDTEAVRDLVRDSVAALEADATAPGGAGPRSVAPPAPDEGDQSE